MAVDVFGTEMRPGDLFVSSSAGNGYLELNCVTRVMPKSVEHTGYPNKVNSEKCVVVSVEKARAFNTDEVAYLERTIQKSLKLKDEYGIED